MRKLILILTILLTPNVAFASGLTGITNDVFGRGGEGFIITVILALAIGSWVFEQICSAIGKGSFGNWVKVGSLFIALGLFVGTVISIISGIVANILQ